MDDLKPLRRLIGSRDELATTVSELLARARLAVRCCSADGSLFNLSNSAVVDVLGTFLLHDSRARVYVLVDDPTWIDTRAARFKLLQRRFPHALRVRAANADDPVGEISQLLVDENDFAAIEPARVTTGEVWLNNPLQTQPRVREFDRRWQMASHDLPVAPLGL